MCIAFNCVAACTCVAYLHCSLRAYACACVLRLPFQGMALDSRKSSIADFLVANNMVADVYNGQVKTYKIAELILKLLSYEPDAHGPMSRHGMAANVKRYLATLMQQRPDAANLRMSDSSFDVDLLPLVLQQFTATEYSAADMDSIFQMMGPLPERTRRTYTRKDTVPTAPVVPLMAPGEGAGTAIVLPAKRGADALVPSAAPDYGELEKHQLVQLLEKRDKTVVVLRDELKAVRKSRGRQTDKLAQLEKDHDSLQKDYAALMANSSFRRGRVVPVVAGYTLATRRNIAHAGALATVRMLTGVNEPGSLKSKNIVVRFEHMLSAAKALRARAFHGASCAGAAEPTSVFECYLLKCDATNQEAIKKAKVHVAVVHSAKYCAEHALASCCLPIRPDAAAQHVEVLSTVADLAKCVESSGRETYAHAMGHLESLGCPTWLVAAARPREASPGLSLYTFGIDAGPDNVGMLQHIVNDVCEAPHVAVHACFCMHHQCHLVVKDLLCVVETWSWGHALSRGRHRYWPSVAAVANVWRSTGMPARLRAAALEEYESEPLVAKLFRKLPGRPLRGRWGSIAAVEERLVAVADSVGRVFSRALGISAGGHGSDSEEEEGAPPRPPKRVKPGDEEDKEFQQKQKNYRRTAVVCTNDRFWKAAVEISFVAKKPLTKYFAWAQKRKGELNKLAADAAPDAYLGPTPLSLLVCGYGKTVVGELEELLGHGADLGAWANVWHMIPETAFPSARLLIVSLVLRAMAGWDARVMRRSESYPLVLLQVVDSPQDDATDATRDLRRELARRFLAADVQDLVTKTSDVAFKAREYFKAAWRRMEADGSCEPALYMWLLVWRMQLPHDTQDIEGANSIIQMMAKTAPNMHIPLCSDRLRIKLGTPLPTEDAAALHPAVLDFIGQPQYQQRFEAAPLADAAGAAVGAAPLEDARPPPGAPPVPGRPKAPVGPAARARRRRLLALADASRFAAPIAAMKPDFMDKLFCLEAPDDRARRAFLLCWSYKRKATAAMGTLRREGGEWRFHLDMPICLRPLLDVIAEFRGDAALGSKAPMSLWSGHIDWVSLQVAIYEDDEPVDIAPRKRAARNKAGPDGGDPGDGVEDAAEEEQDEDALLEEYLGEIMEERGEYSDYGSDSGDEAGGGGGGGDIAPHPADIDLGPDGVELPDGGGHAGGGDGGDGEFDDPIPGGTPPTGAPGTPVLIVPPELAMLAQERQGEVRGAEARALERKGRALVKGTVSLVSLPDGRAIFLSWTRPEIKEARVVRLDLKNRVIALMPHLQPTITYDDLKFVVDDTGLYLGRPPKGERLTVDDWLLKLQLKEHTTVHQGPLKPNDGEICAVCERINMPRGEPVPDDTQDDIMYYRCMQCLSVWHNCCAQRYHEYGVDPGAFDEFVCPACRPP